MLPETLNTSSAKPTAWNRQTAFSSSQVSSFMRTIHSWIATATTSSRS